MREIFTSGSVGRASGNRCLYPEPDNLQAARFAVPLSRHVTAKRSSYKLQVSLALGGKSLKLQLAPMILQTV